MKKKKEGVEQIREVGVGNLLPFIYPEAFDTDKYKIYKYKILISPTPLVQSWIASISVYPI